MQKQTEERVVDIKVYFGNAKCRLCEVDPPKAQHKATTASGGVLYACTPCLKKLRL